MSLIPPPVLIDGAYRCRLCGCHIRPNRWHMGKSCIRNQKRVRGKWMIDPEAKR